MNIALCTSRLVLKHHLGGKRNQVHRLLGLPSPGAVDHQRTRLVQGCGVGVVGLCRPAPHLRPDIRSLPVNVCRYMPGRPVLAIEVRFGVYSYVWRSGGGGGGSGGGGRLLYLAALAL